MEGAAFHYVCLQQKINFLQIRGISNMVGERDKTKWKIKKAIENLNNELLKIIKHSLNIMKILPLDFLHAPTILLFLMHW